jgi:hypothetical protein
MLVFLPKLCFSTSSMAKSRKYRTAGLHRAIEAAGSITLLTGRINEVVSRQRRLTVQAVAQWESVPADRCPEVEKATGVARDVLRPDIYGPAPKTEQRVCG